MKVFGRVKSTESANCFSVFLRDVLEFVNVLNVTELFTCYIINSIKTTFNFVHTRAWFFLIFTESPSLRKNVDVLFSDGGMGTAG
jgi:hypothetical protein